jgi:hypothetical protein
MPPPWIVLCVFVPLWFNGSGKPALPANAKGPNPKRQIPRNQAEKAEKLKAET